MLIFLISAFWFASLLQAFAIPGDSCKVILDKKLEKKYNDATLSFKHGNYMNTIILLKELLKDEPECTDASYLMGLACVKKAIPDYKNAEKWFMQVLMACPTYDIYLYLSLIHI